MTITVLEPLTAGYVTPEGFNAHRYNVKRPVYIHRDLETREETHVPRVYTYNKLLANPAIFEPAGEERPIRAIHLSRDSDPRNIEGRLGIERRNRLSRFALGYRSPRERWLRPMLRVGCGRERRSHS